MTNRKQQSAGEPGRKLLQALRRCPTRGGVAALRGIEPLLAEALASESIDAGADASRASKVEDALGFVLARVLGVELGEKTPTNLEELAALVAEVEGAPEDAAARAVLVPIAGELRAAWRRAREIGGANALEAAAIAALREVQRTVTRANARLAESRSELAAMRAMRAAPTALPIDPAVQLRRLDAWSRDQLERLRETLSAMHAPIRLELDEALAVAEWSVLGGPRPERRAAILELARRLEEFLRRAPVSGPDLEAVLALARAADAEQRDAAWKALADRVWMVRGRLLGEAKPLPPFYRSQQATQESPIRPAGIGIAEMLASCATGGR